MNNLNREQIMLTAYVNHHTRFLKLGFEGDNILKVRDNGKIRRLTLNLWGDVFDADTGEKLAISNLPHDDIPGDEQATKWTPAKQAWNPEIEEDDNLLEEVQFLVANENMTPEEAVVNLPKYKNIAEGYLDYLIMQREKGIVK